MVDKARTFDAQDSGDGLVGFVLADAGDGGDDPPPAKTPAKAKSKTRKR